MTHRKGMKIYGIISGVDVRGALAERVLRAGLYLATAGDENFKKGENFLSSFASFGNWEFMESLQAVPTCIGTMNPVGRVCPSEPALWNTL